jgi:hypothetical protein
MHPSSRPRRPDRLGGSYPLRVAVTMRTSRLVTVTHGRCRLVPADSITDYVQLLLEEYRAGGDGHAA